MAIVLGKDFDQNAGGQMGEAFGRGLQALAQHKIGKMMERHQVQKLGNAYEQMGFPRGLAALPESAQKAYIANNYPQPQQQYIQQEEPLQQMQSMAPQEIMPQQTPDQLFKQFERVAFRPQNAAQSVAQAMSGGVKMPTTQPQLNLPKKSKAQVGPQVGLGVKQTAPQVAQPLKMQEPWQVLQNRPRNKQEETLFKDARAEQHLIEKNNKEFVDDLEKRGGTFARMTDITLDKLNKLIDSGKLTGPTMYNFRKKLEEHGGALGTGIGAALGTVGGAILGAPMAGVGAVGGALAGSSLGAGVGKGVGELIGQKFVGSKEDQEFLKLSLGTFLPRMKDIFGARVAIQEMQVFMDSIPALSQTDEGKRAIIKNMKLTNDAYKEMLRIKNNIVKQHGGYEPKNLKELVDKEAAPMLDRMAVQFMQNVPKDFEA